MWCNSCQQDVPVVTQGAGRRMVCARCQHPLPKGQPAHTARICDEGIALNEPAAAEAAATPPLRSNEDWSNRRQMRSIGRELRRPTFATATATSKLESSPTARNRFDPPQNLFDQSEHTIPPAVATVTSPALTYAQPRSRRNEGPQIVAWLVVTVGTIGLTAGLGLLAWSIRTNQMTYWNHALGLTLGGQGTLIMGLVLAVSRLWRSSRFAAQRLQDVHARLAQVQQTAEALTATRSAGAPAFYADLARGASPQMLLANLKGQVDQLATRLSGGW